MGFLLQFVISLIVGGFVMKGLAGAGASGLIAGIGGLVAFFVTARIGR